MLVRLWLVILSVLWLGQMVWPLSVHSATINVNTAAELNSAIAAINPGDTIVIENGTYTNWGKVTILHTSDCTQAQPCTLTAETEGSVVFSGNGALTLDIRSRYWTVSKIKWQNQTNFGNYSTPTASSTGPLIVFDGAQDVTVDDITTSNLSGTGVVIAVMKHLGVRDTLRNTVQNSTFDGFTHTSSGSTFIYVLGKGERGFNTDFNILDNMFKNRVGSASSNSQYWIRYGNSNDSSYIGGRNLIDPPRDSNLFIRRNIFQNMTANNNGQDAWHLKASFVEATDNIFINETRVNFRNGQGNKFVGNEIRNPNTVKSDHALFIADEGHLIANNLCITNRSDRTCIQLSRGTTDTDSNNKLDYKPFSGALYNNTFDGFSDEAIMAAKNSNGNNEGTTTVNPTITDFKCNVIRQNAGIMLDGLNCATLFTAADHNSWSGTATPDCITQSGAGDVLAAPDWTNPAGGDYTLKNTSPLIDACIDIPGVPETNFDIDGDQRDNTPDIGAYEFGASPPPPASTCDTIFGSAADYLLCEETSLTCEFNVTLSGTSCDTLCGSFGKTCVAAYDNDPGSCTRLSADTCATTRTDEICICEIDAPPPPPPSVSTFFVDDACVGSQGNGTTTACGANGPWTSLEYALEVADCAGMSPGDILEVRGMTTSPSAGNWYTDNYYQPLGSIDLDSACSGITIRPYSGATEHVVVDGSIDLSTTVSWTSIGSGVYESGAHPDITVFPHRAWYKRGANPEETLDLIQSVQVCTSALAVNKMRYNPLTKKVCAHLSDGSSPGSSTYFRVPARLNALNFRLEDVDDVTVEASGATFLLTRFARELVTLNPSVNQNITINGLTLSEALGGIDASGGVGLGNYNFSNNTLTNLGETGIKWFDALGSATIIGNSINNIGMSPNFEQCQGVGAGCLAGYDSNPRAIWLNNCATRDDVTRATVQDNTITAIGGGYNGFSGGIESTDCTHANIIDSNLITASTASSQTGFRAIFFTGIPSAQYHDHVQVTNNRCEAVDYCVAFDYDTATDQTGMRNFVYGNTCHNANTTCWIHESGPNVGGELFFKNNLASSDDGDGVLLMSVPSSTMWNSGDFAYNGFECDHANCSSATIATFQGNNYQRAGDCTPTTDCIEDINAFSNIYGTMNVTAVSLDIPSGSAAIDAGVTLGLLPHDYKKLSRPFGVTSDIGAHEYDGTTPSFDLTQRAFRFGDRGAATSQRPLAAENKASRFYVRSQFTLRISVTGDAGTTSHLADLALYYQHCNPSCGSYTQITPTCTGNPACLIDDPVREDGDSIANDLVLAGRTFLAESAFYDTAQDGIEATISENDQLELEFSIGMGTIVALGDVLNFRVYNADATALNAYSVTPSITIGSILGTIYQSQ